MIDANLCFSMRFYIFIYKCIFFNYIYIYIYVFIYIYSAVEKYMKTIPSMWGFS